MLRIMMMRRHIATALCASVAGLLLFAGSALSQAWGGESPLEDQIASLRTLVNAKIHWLQRDQRFPVPEHEFMRVQGQYFHAHRARGNLNELGNRGVMFAYNPRGYFHLYVNQGSMTFERDPVDPKTPLNLERTREILTLLRPIAWLGMPDGDSSQGLFWGNLFNDDYLKRQFTALVSKQEADGKGGIVLTIKTKLPSVNPNGDIIMAYSGNEERILLEIPPHCGANRLVTAITYHNPTGAMTARYQFEYEMVTIGDNAQPPQRSIPLLKSGRLTDASDGSVIEQFERVEIDLVTRVQNEDLIIDPVLAKTIHDAGSGLNFTPDQ